MPMRGIRGATTAAERTRESVLAATEELLRALVKENTVEPEDVAAVLFTASPDLSAEYPATAARVGLGWTYVPLMSAQEIATPHGQVRCIRILILWNTDKTQREIKHVYLGEAADLRSRDRSSLQ